MKRWFPWTALLLCAGCGIQNGIERSLDEIKASNVKQEKLLEATVRMENLTRELLGITRQLAELTALTAASVNRSNEMQEKLVDKMTALSDMTLKLIKEVDRLGTQTTELKTLTGEVVRLIGQLVKGMERTNEGVRLQIMTVALEQMLSERNTESLSPPARLIPYAVTFTKEATAKEILEVFHTFVMDVLYGGITDKEAPTEADLRIKGRRVSLSAAGALAAFTPPEKVREILTEEIEKKGRYLDTARAFAATRFVFIRDFLFQPVISANTVSVALLRQAVEHFRELKYLAERPYAKELAVLVANLTPGPAGFGDLEIAVAPGELKSLGRTAAGRFGSELTPEEVESPEVKKLLEELRR